MQEDDLPHSLQWVLPRRGVKALIDGLPGGCHTATDAGRDSICRRLIWRLTCWRSCPCIHYNCVSCKMAMPGSGFPAKSLYMSPVTGKHRELQRFENSFPVDLEGTHFQPFHWSGTTTARFIRLKVFSTVTPAAGSSSMRSLSGEDEWIRVRRMILLLTFSGIHPHGYCSFSYW